MDGPGVEVKSVDVSGFNANEDFLPGMVNYGKFTFTLGYDQSSANSTQLSTLAVGRTIANWKVLWPDATTNITFHGYITKFNPSFGKGEYTKVKLELQLTTSAF